MDQTREERIDEILRTIAGLQISIIDAKEARDWDFAKRLEPLKKVKAEKLRRLMYGLPEERTRQRQSPSQDPS